MVIEGGGGVTSFILPSYAFSIELKHWVLVDFQWNNRKIWKFAMYLADSRDLKQNDLVRRMPP